MSTAARKARKRAGEKAPAKPVKTKGWVIQYISPMDRLRETIAAAARGGKQVSG